MSKVTLDSFSDTLKAYLESVGVTESQILAMIQEEIDKLTSDDIAISSTVNDHGRNLSEELLAAWNMLALVNALASNNQTIIGDTALNTTSQTITGAINELKSATPDVADLAFGNFGIVDNRTRNHTTNATLTTDLLGSNGQVYMYNTTSTAANLYTGTFPDVKYGKYALCMRLKINTNTSTSTVLTANVLNGSTNILSKPILGTNFDRTDNFCYICTTFEYTGSTGTAKQPLKLNINTGTVSNLQVMFDYAYITLITPAVYI